jgi:hypothetical protein
MAGHSRSQNGVASLAYDPAIHVLLSAQKDVDARVKPAHDAHGGYDAASIASPRHSGQRALAR